MSVFGFVKESCVVCLSVYLFVLFFRFVLFVVFFSFFLSVCLLICWAGFVVVCIGCCCLHPHFFVNRFATAASGAFFSLL